MICSVDYGHSTVKGLSYYGREMAIPSILTTDVKAKDYIEVPDNYDKLDYILIRYGEREYFIGNLAKRQSRLILHNIHDEDMLSEETKTLILTMLAILSNNYKVNLATDLPTSLYKDYKEPFKAMLKGEHKIEIYDFRKRIFEEKRINIDYIDVNPQGRYALLSYVLDGEGEIKRTEEVWKVASGLSVVIDWGLYSTDIYISDGLQTVFRVPDRPIAGMIEAYKIISSYLAEEYGLRKRPFEIEDNVKTGSVKIGNKTFDITPLIEYAYNELARMVLIELNNLIGDFIDEVDYFLHCGGGGIGIHKIFGKMNLNRNGEERQQFLLPHPLYANAIGGLKLLRRKLKDEENN